MANKVIFKSLVSVAVLSSLFAVGAAQAATGSAGATVLTPIAVAHNTGASLQFGTVSPSTTVTSTVTIPVTSTGMGIATSSNTSFYKSTGASADSFAVTGSSGATYAITVDASVALAGTTNPANTMSASLTAVAASGATPTLGASGDTIYVGGTLNLGVNQAADTYVGSYALTVAYQ